MGVYVVENLSRVFLSEWLLYNLWVIKVYIVWVKGKKVTLKIFQKECFMTISRESLTRETLTKLTVWHDSLVSSHMLFTRLLRGLASCKLLVKST